MTALVAVLVIVTALIVAVKLRRSEDDDLSPAERAVKKNGIMISSAYANQAGASAVLSDEARRQVLDQLRGEPRD